MPETDTSNKDGLELAIERSQRFGKLKAAGYTLLGAMTMSVFNSYFYDNIKDKISPSIRSVFYHKQTVQAAQGRAAILRADKMSEEGHREDAQELYNLGVELLSSAAQAEIPEAMRDLGRLLCFGRAGYLNADTARAKYLLSKAAAKGEQDATTILIGGCRHKSRS